MIMFGENLIFFANFSDFASQKNSTLSQKIKIFKAIMIITHQKGPVNSIKKQKYIQIVGNIWQQQVQEQVY